MSTIKEEFTKDFKFLFAMEAKSMSRQGYLTDKEEWDDNIAEKMSTIWKYLGEKDKNGLACAEPCLLL